MILSPGAEAPCRYQLAVLEFALAVAPELRIAGTRRLMRDVDNSRGVDLLVHFLALLVDGAGSPSFRREIEIVEDVLTLLLDDGRHFIDASETIATGHLHRSEEHTS